MSKKKRNNQLNFREVKLCEGTILEQFEDYLKDHRKVSDIIGFLSVQNARLIALTEEQLTDDLKEELADFYEYFDENFDDLTYEARMENWGREPRVLLMGEAFSYEREIRVRDKYLSELNPKIRKEAETLCDKLFNIRTDRILSFVFPEDYFVMDFERNIPKEFLEDTRKQLLFACGMLIENDGAVTVRCIYKDRTEIFGILARNHRWIPISKQNMLDAHTLAPNGIRLEPKDGVVYTEIERKVIQIPER